LATSWLKRSMQKTVLTLTVEVSDVTQNPLSF